MRVEDKPAVPESSEDAKKRKLMDAYGFKYRLGEHIWHTAIHLTISELEFFDKKTDAELQEFIKSKVLSAFK